MNRKKILLDTDIGDDIDDAFALALLVRSPEIELVAVTTVFRNVEQRAKIALALLEDLEATDIPVYLGEKGTPDKMNRIFPYEKFDERGMPIVAHFGEDMAAYLPRKEDGVNVILKNIERYGKDLEILAIGPLTNLAAAFEKSPEIFKKVGSITVMGAAAFSDYPEWNTRWDTKAARTVFNCGVPVRVVGLNVTKQCVFSEEDLKFFRANLNGKYTRLKRMMEIWIKNIAGKTNPIMHDPLAAAVLIGEFCKFEAKYIYVWLEKDDLGRTGYTHCFDYKVPESGKVKVATAVNARSFMEFLKERLTEGKE